MNKQTSPSSLVLAGLFLLAVYSLFPPHSRPGQASRTSADSIALVDAKIYPSPESNPIEKGVVLIRDGKIAAAADAREVRIPDGTRVLDCAGTTITAGFWNSHVHFTESKWENAASQPAGQLEAQLRAMLTRYGFVAVTDTGSFLENTLALRARIESGEVAGPEIRTAGGPLYPKDGIPFYLRNSLTAEVLKQLAQPAAPLEAAGVARQRIAGGADVIKLFTGSWVERGRVLPMQVEIAVSAAAEARGAGKLVFAHASNVAGLEVALEARVDVLAHALDDDRGLNESHFARMKTGRMALIPTLKLFSGNSYTGFIVKEVGGFQRAGGQLLFGTDVGYLADYDPTEEYILMSRAGLGFREILASLTTGPADRFGLSRRSGRIAPGLDADLVVLAADPAQDARAFVNVRYTFRRGRMIYGSL